MDNRDKIKTIRVSKREEQQLLKEAAKMGLCLSAYIRSVLFAEQTQILQAKAEDENRLEQLIYQIRKIGINIDQITWHCNAGFFNDRDKRRLGQLTDELERLVLFEEQYLRVKERRMETDGDHTASLSEGS